MESIEWQSRWLEVLILAGLSQSQAMADFYERHGKGDGVDTSKCPECAAEQFLLSKGMIPAIRRG
jgi:hypothetical protein